MKRGYFILILINLFLLTSCTAQIKNNHIYVTEKRDESHIIVNSYPQLSTTGINPFVEIKHKNEFQNLNNSILIAVSIDENIAFYIERIIKNEFPKLIKGEPKERVKLVKVDRKNKNSQIIAEDIPFISIVRWNKDESMIAFGGQGQVFVYDLFKNELLTPPLLKDKEITYFGWSPDGKKLFLEDTLLANDSVWYIESARTANSYETKETTYYKGILDNSHYYGTKSIQTSQGIITKTIVIDDKGDVVKDFPQGKFRDAYGKAILLTGEKKEGLFIIADINKPKERKLITKEYVYDSKFIYNGQIAYIIRNNDIEKNEYMLCISNKEGNTVVQIPVSGCNIAMEPDGRYGVIGGENLEKIDFVALIVERKESLASDNDTEKNEALKTVRGAVDTYYKFVKGIDKDNSLAEKYFSYTSNPEQCAYFDIINVWNKKGIEVLTINDHPFDIYLEKYDKYSDIDGQSVSIKLRCTAKDYDNRVKEEYLALELKKRSTKWYVVGFSTFTHDSQFNIIRQVAESVVKNIKDSNVFDGVLKGKDIEIGQIQFWNKNKSALAADMSEADSIKVYLKTSEGARTIIYSLVINKKGKDSWEPVLVKKIE